MSRSFDIIRNPFNKNEYLFDKKSITIESGVTVLIGCNGAGKSTMLHMIESDLKKENIQYIKYDNYSEGGSNAISSAGFHGNMETMATLATSSEGEQITINLSNFSKKIGDFVRKNEKESELWILLDAIDSGLSIDNIIDIKRLFKLILSDNTNKDIYILVSANCYELCRNSNCFDVIRCKYTTFTDYEDYRSYIVETWHQKYKRYEKKG